MAQVFTSYSRKDKDFVRKLSDALASQKREAWTDWKDIPLTAEWQQEILTNIETAENFLFVISPDSATSANCRKEIDHAVANNKRMFPIVRRSVPDDALPEALGKFQWIDFSDDDTFEARFATLIAALDTDLAWVNAHTRLLTRAKEWEREGKDNSFLLHGKDLREAERWIARSSEKDPKPTTLQSQYILVSRQAATKLQRIVIAAIAIAFLIAVGLAVDAFLQKNVAQRNARESKARELAAFSSESLSEDPEKSILLGVQAVNATLRFGQPPVPAAEEALHEAILSSQIRMTLRGHSGPVNAVAFSPDGKRLATASGDQTAKVWDAESGKELRTLRGHSSGVDGVAFSPDGKRLATVSYDQTAKVWDAESGQELLTLRGHSKPVSGVAFSPDGKRLATASLDDTAKVWEAESGKELLTLRGHSSGVDGVAFSPDGKRLATASWDRTTKVWDAESGKELLTLRGHSAFVDGVAFSLDGKRLATASEDQTAKVWEAESGKELLTLRGHLGSVDAVAFSPDGKRLATAGEDRTAKVWDAESGKELLTLRGHSGVVHGVAFSPDGKRLATASVDGTVQVYALDLRELLNLARSRVTRTFTAEECQRYFQSDTCPLLP